MSSHAKPKALHELPAPGAAAGLPTAAASHMDLGHSNAAPTPRPQERKRILFVEDDHAVMEASRLRLRRFQDQWDMEFTDGAQTAIALLEQRPFDVVITDMCMPGMDGAQLLQTVRERWPDAVRIVLSGYAELEQSVRLAAVAHQCLNKPVDLQALENAIDRCASIQSLLHNPALRAAVGKLGALPPKPQTYAALRQAMSVETASARDIARIIEQDTVIAAKLLQMVNSAFFRLPRHITDIEQAVAYLGFLTVQSLVVSAEIFSKRAPSTRQIVDFDQLQKHSLRVAAAARVLTAGTNLAEEALLAALLHDIGYWVLAQQCPSALEDAVRHASCEHLALDEAERIVLGASHAEIGAYVLGLWGFPLTIVEAVAHHHDPASVPQTQYDVLAALSVAHALAHPAEASAFKGPMLPHSEVDPRYLDTINAPFRWADAARRVALALKEEGVKAE